MDFLQRTYRSLFRTPASQQSVTQGQIQEIKEDRPTLVEERIPRRRVLTRLDILSDVEGSINPFGLERKVQEKKRSPSQDFPVLIVDELQVLKNKTCNDPISLENQDADSTSFVKEENDDHFLLIGKIDDKFYIDCAYRTNLKTILSSLKYKCSIMNENYYTLTTSFDPYLRVSEKELNKIVNSSDKIYYLIPTKKMCGNGKIYEIKICGGENCLEKIFKL